MSYLLYGIVHGDRTEPREKLKFAGYPRASIMVRTERLGAIVSKLSLADADPDVMRLLIYSKIVESFNNERAVIPMRYGCRFESISDIVEFLEKEQGTFGALLDELDGRVEMSVNLTLDDSRDDREPPAPPLLSSPMPAGIGYLAGRRRYYSLVDQSGARRENVRKSLCALAEGKFIRAVPEQSTRDPKSMLTIHFLVPREGVAEFTRALRADCRRSIEISGPWPPYNFVSKKASALTI